MTIEIKPRVSYTVEYGMFGNVPSSFGPVSGNYEHNVTLKTVKLEFLTPSGFRHGQSLVATTLEETMCQMVQELLGGYAPRRDGEVGEFGE